MTDYKLTDFASIAEAQEWLEVYSKDHSIDAIEIGFEGNFFFKRVRAMEYNASNGYWFDTSKPIEYTQTYSGERLYPANDTLIAELEAIEAEVIPHFDAIAALTKRWHQALDRAGCLRYRDR